MKLIKSPHGVNMSGQACIAMILESSIEQVTSSTGKGLLKTWKIIKALIDNNIRCSLARETFPNWRLCLLNANHGAIVRISYCLNRYYWVLLYNDIIYDPLKGKIYKNFDKAPRTFIIFMIKK